MTEIPEGLKGLERFDPATAHQPVPWGGYFKVSDVQAALSNREEEQGREAVPLRSWRVNCACGNHQDCPGVNCVCPCHPDQGGEEAVISDSAVEAAKLAIFRSRYNREPERHADSGWVKKGDQVLLDAIFEQFEPALPHLTAHQRDDEEAFKAGFAAGERNVLSRHQRDVGLREAVEWAIVECAEGTVTGAEKAQHRLEAALSLPTGEQGEDDRG